MEIIQGFSHTQKLCVVELVLFILNFEQDLLLLSIIELGDWILLNIVSDIDDFIKMIPDLLHSGKLDLTLINIESILIHAQVIFAK